MRFERSAGNVNEDPALDATRPNVAPGLIGRRTTNCESSNCESSVGDLTTINPDWSDDDRPVGIETSGACRTLPPGVLDLADRRALPPITG